MNSHVIYFYMTDGSNTEYVNRFQSMSKNDPNTWFLPFCYSILQTVSIMGSLDYSYHNSRLNITVRIGSDLFAAINAAHKHYQESILISKMNKEAKKF